MRTGLNRRYERAVPEVIYTRIQGYEDRKVCQGLVSGITREPDFQAAGLIVEDTCICL